MHRFDKLWTLYLICWQMKMFILIWNWFIRMIAYCFPIDSSCSKRMHWGEANRLIESFGRSTYVCACVWDSCRLFDKGLCQVRAMWNRFLIPIRQQELHMWFMVMMFKRHLYAFVAELRLSMNNKHTQIHMWIEDINERMHEASDFIIGLTVVRLEDWKWLKRHEIDHSIVWEIGKWLMPSFWFRTIQTSPKCFLWLNM